MKSVRELMLELVAIPSVSETAGENAIAEHILRLVREDGYFTQNPGHCGAWDGGDRLGRPVVWALKKGRGRRTIVFSGHYDTVGTQCYGALEPLALNPDALRRAMLENPPDDPLIRADLTNENWLFGRGAADMKSGLALNLNALYNYAPDEVNLLFTAVSDEENLSAGARQAVALYAELAQRFDLEYTLGVISEPTERDVEAGAPHPVIHGGAGKILPVAVARGTPEHGAFMLRGINSAHLIANVISLTEYDTAFVSGGGGLFTEPPAAQLVRDMKNGYDVSMPEYTACAFNFTFFSETDPQDLLDRLAQNCRRAADGLIARYDACFSEMEKAGQTDPAKRRHWKVRVELLDKLERELESRDGFAAVREQFKRRAADMVAGGETMQWATICYIRDIIAWAGFSEPMIVIGIAPPYYPSVHTDSAGGDITPIVCDAASALAREGIELKRVEYSQAMMDFSYTSCANSAAAARVTANIPLPESLYGMDVAAMAALRMPTLVIGCAFRDVHQAGERVWLPDLERDLPKIFDRLIRSTAKTY